MQRHTLSTKSPVPARHTRPQAVLMATAMGALTLTSLTSATEAVAADLMVRYDQAQLLRLPRPINEVIVGNASIADVTVQGGNLLVITGKSFGVTNVIALDAERNIIQDQRIIVERDQTLLNVHRGTGRATYSCAPQRQPNITIGDDKEYFNTLHSQTSSKTGLSDTQSADKSGQ